MNYSAMYLELMFLVSSIFLVLAAKGGSGSAKAGPVWDLLNRRQAACNEDEFECDDETCISGNRECNWYLDCVDMSDEGDHCRYEGFKCNSGDHMVSLKWLCDGVEDCDDGSDEEAQYCHDHASIPKACPRLSCDNSTLCLNEKELCDGIKHCKDGLDESLALCKEGHGECFSCDLGLNCLDWDWVCDEIADCKDMSDEVSDWCGTVFQRCWKGSFLCGHDHFCVPQRWRCDDSNDCGDDTDEKDCESDAHWTGTSEWSEWGSWSACHPSCGVGTRSRSRVCDAVPGGACPGVGLEEDHCDQAPCVQDTSVGCGIKQHLHLRDDGLALGERIVGGRSSDHGEWPWQAQLFYRRRGSWQAVCGGTLIGPQTVLSAAHCFMGTMRAASKWQVHLGKHSIGFVPETGSQHRLVREIIVHHDFSEHGGVTGDIAILILDSLVSQETGQINWACLDEGMPLPSDTECYISGWGVTEMGGSQGSSVLLEARMPLIPRRVCNRWDSYDGAIQRTMLCAGIMEGGIDACKGDSGGPLSCLGPDDRWYVVGITSWGHGCALPKKPGVYTRVSMYHDWIQHTIHHHQPLNHGRR